MSDYNFDRVILRRGTGALKYDALKERYGNPDLWPLWVADMDFETPDFIIKALKQRLDHPIFGYSIVPEEFWQCIIDWLKTHHSWDVKREWLNYIPGIVKGIGFVINKFSLPGDKIIIQPPVYHPFRLVTQGNERIVVNNPLLEVSEGIYKMNIPQLRELAIDESTKILILSNPHNPIGIIWDKETLREVAEICFDNNILVISDEIHCDLTLWGNSYHPFAKVSEKAAGCSISFGSPSKTFNMAGIVSSYSIIPDKRLRDEFYKWMDANEFTEPTIFATLATIAAYSKGERWRKEVVEYIEKNIEYVRGYCKKNIR